MSLFDFSTLQSEVGAWSDKTFPNDLAHHKLLGVMEEVGELAEAEDGGEHLAGLLVILGRLAHAQLKTEEGIRVSENHDQTAKDSVADIVIFLAGYCHKRNFSLQECVEGTWTKIVTKRGKLDFINAGQKP